MTTTEWQNLLWHGHSFYEHHHIFGWPLNGTPAEEPPRNLATNHHDGELEHLVMDHQWAKRLQEQLRDALYRCYDCWVGLRQQGDAKAGHPGEMDKTKEHLHPGEMDKIKEHLHPGGIDKIKEHLVSFKLILVDKVKPRETMLVLELREEDTLYYATKHLKAIEDLQGQGVSGLEKVLLR